MGRDNPVQFEPSAQNLDLGDGILIETRVLAECGMVWEQARDFVQIQEKIANGIANDHIRGVFLGDPVDDSLEDLGCKKERKKNISSYNYQFIMFLCTRLDALTILEDLDFHLGWRAPFQTGLKLQPQLLVIELAP